MERPTPKSSHLSAAVLLLVLSCGGKTDLLATDDGSVAPRGYGGALNVGGAATVGGSGAGSTEPPARGGAPVGTIAGCEGPEVDFMYWGPFNRTVQFGGDARIHPSCSSGEDATPARFFIVKGGAGFQVDTYGSDFDTVLALYDGVCTTRELACDDDGAPGLARTSRLTIPETASGTVTVGVTGSGSSSGTISIHISRDGACGETALIGSIDAMAYGSTVGREDRYASECSTRVSSPDSTYYFTPSFSGVYDIAITESDFDPLLVVVEGGCAGQELLCIDDRDGDLNPRVGRYLEGGKRYAIVVDSYGGTAGTFTLSVLHNETDPGYCCAASPTRASCSVASISACVCAIWPTCCSESWSEACLLAADSLGCGRDTRCDEPP